MAGTVILVEDEQSIGALVRGYLQREGHQVVWVRSGEEALRELTRHPVRLIVLDVGLPGMDGFDATRRIRLTSPSTSVVMLTAFDGPAVEQSALQAGAAGVVTKGAPLEDVVGVILEAAARRT